jgi:hypothetical protein
MADALVVERVRWIKTFAQHATLEALELKFRKRQINIKTDASDIHRHLWLNGFMATGCQQITPLLKRAGGTVLRAQCGCERIGTGLSNAL